MKENLPKRSKLPHDVPTWVSQGSCFFITVCCQPRKANQLCKEEIAKGIFETVSHRYHSGEWWVRLMLLMPDHIHALMSFSSEIVMRDSIASWKRYIATKLGIDWQPDFFDHRIRDNENLDEKAHYIRMNPVRESLCKRPEDWKYVWSFREFEGL